MISKLGHSLATLTKDLKAFKEEQPALARKRKEDLEEVKRTGKIDSSARQDWVFTLRALEDFMRKLQEFDMVWKDTSALVAKIGTDLKKDLALVEAASSGSDGAKFKANNFLRQQADAVEAVMKRSQLLKSDIKPLFELINRDADINPDDRKRMSGVMNSSTGEIEKTLTTLEGNLQGMANSLRNGLE